MRRTALSVISLIALASVVSADDPPSVVRTVTVTAEGRPVAKASVWAVEYREDGDESAEPKPLVTDADGRVNLPAGKAAQAWRLFARDADGRIGSEFASFRRDPDENPAIRLALVRTSGRAGRVIGPDGKPVAGAVVTPVGFYVDENVRESRRLPSSVDLPAWEQKRRATKTDAAGKFELAAPADYRPFFRVQADGFDESKWSAPVAGDLEVKLYAPGTVSVTVAGVEPGMVKGVAIRLQLSSVDPPAENEGVKAVRWYAGTLDAAGKVTLTGVAPGRYDVTVVRNPKASVVFLPGKPVEVTAGKTAEVTARFGPATRVSGRITAPDGKTGLPAVLVMVTVSDDQGGQPNQWLHAETDRDGGFAVHGSAGWYRFFLNVAPDGYVLPQGNDWPKPVKVEAAKEHAFAPFPLQKSVSFVGEVVDTDGKPVAGAAVVVGEFHNSPRNGRVVSGKDGQFTLKNFPPDDAIAPRVRTGKAVNVPQTFDLSKTTGPERIEVSEANAVGFKGRVTDAAGRPIAGAKVQLIHILQGVGRNASYGVHRPTETVTTDADGRYSFAGYWAKDRYGVQVKADGYADGETKGKIAEAGEVKEFPVVKLIRSNLSVRGTVIGADAKPVAGVEVFQVDGPARTSVKTAADGSFTLVGFRDTAGFVFARKAGFRLVAVPVFPSKPDAVKVTLIAADAPPPAAPEVPAGHQAALDKLARHTLTKLWDGREKFGGENAISRMAVLDPDTAKKWADAEKERTGGKTDYTSRIEAAKTGGRLKAVARTDIDEGVAAIGAMSADDGFFQATRIGRELLATDKAKALRMAEEAVVKARQRELPDRVWSLAEAGALAAEAGSDGGKAILLEAAELAAKLTPDVNGRNGMNVGMTAARLAPYDWPKAEALLDTLKDPGDYNRFLAATVARLAATDPDRAKKLLDRFKPTDSNSPQLARVRAALAIARTKPDEAVELVVTVKDEAYRFRGLIQVAEVIATTDRPKAVKTIDVAFALLGNADGFRSWSNFGGGAAFAAAAAVRAKEIGHPDVAGLVARALALRPTGRDVGSPEYHEQQLVQVAAAVALVDPAAARHMLAAIAPPDELVAKALVGRRDWLFALALADPERAITLVDKIFDRAKDARGRDALSGTGVSELTSILTAKDRLAELAMWGTIHWDRDFE